MFDSRDASCQFSFTENHFRSVTQALTMLQVFLLQNVNAQSRRENYQQSTFRTELREREAAVDLVTPEWLPWRYTFFKNLRFSSKHISTGWHIQTDTVYIYRERGRGSEREEECVTDRRRKRRIESAPQRERERENTPTQEQNQYGHNTPWTCSMCHVRTSRLQNVSRAEDDHTHHPPPDITMIK